MSFGVQHTFLFLLLLRPCKFPCTFSKNPFTFQCLVPVLTFETCLSWPSRFLNSNSTSCPFRAGDIFAVVSQEPKFLRHPSDGIGDIPCPQPQGLSLPTPTHGSRMFQRCELLSPSTGSRAVRGTNLISIFPSALRTQIPASLRARRGRGAT